jgi:mannosyltransferase
VTRRPELWLVGALTVVAAALRFSTLDLQSFWHDEAVTVGRVLDANLFTTLDRVPGSEATPPLYYALAWAWTKVFGSGEAGIRSLSAVFGVATVPVAWWAGRVLIGRAAGVGAAALVAVSPYMVWYSQEARAYALLVLLCALSLALFGEVVRGRGGRWLVGWAVASALALATHYFAVFVVGPELVLMLWFVPAERRRSVLIAGGAVIAVGFALVPLAAYQADQGHDGWIEQIPLGTRIRDTGKHFVLGYSGSPARWLSFVTGLCVAVAAGFAISSGRARRGWQLAAGVGVAALVIPLVAKAVGSDYIYSRNMIGAWAVLVVALGAAACTRWGAVAVGAVCAAFLALTIAVFTDDKLQRADWHRAAVGIGPTIETRALVVPAIGDDPMVYYLGGRKLTRGAVETRRIDVLGFAGAPAPRGRVIPRGFRRFSTEKIGRFDLAHYAASSPRLFTRSQLARMRLGTGHAAVVVEEP